MVALQPINGRKTPACIGTNGVYPIHLLGIGAGIEIQASLQQKAAIRGTNAEPVICEAGYRAGRTQLIGWIDDTVYFEPDLFPAALERFQVAPGLRFHSDGWFFARFFHL